MPPPPPTRERRSARPWVGDRLPESILLIRFHAVGDVAITMPSAAALRKMLPEARIDFLTIAENTGVAEASGLFDKVYPFRSSATRMGKASSALSVLRRLRSHGYDIVVDLQWNWVSRLIRIGLRPNAWSEFDRYSASGAYARTIDAFHDAGFRTISPIHEMNFGALRERTEQMLEAHGWRKGVRTIVLNPAGLWKSRNWPLENYVALARLLATSENFQLLFLGTDRLRVKIEPFLHLDGIQVVNLIGKTTLAQAFSSMQFVDLMVSEDSGLMHMACVSGVPVIALFGSSRHEWSAPVGPESICLHSGDLECASCMEENCRFGDIHCLTRYSAEFVYEKCLQLLRAGAQTSKIV